MTYPMRRRPPNRAGTWPADRRRGYPGVATRTATDAGRDMLRNDPDGWEVDQPWLWWWGEGNGPGRPPSETLWGNPPPGAAQFGTWVPPAVTRCTALICDTLAAMPWQVRRDDEPMPAPTWIEDPQARRRDGRIYGGPLPQWRRTPVEFRSSSIKSALWKGESMWYAPVRDANDNPAPPIWQLNPDMIGVDNGRYMTNPGNPVSLDLADWADSAAEPYYFGDGELIVTRGHLGDGVRGVSVFQNHMHDLKLAGALGGYALNMLRAGVPNGYLKVNSPNLTRPQAQTLQADWMTAHGSPIKRIAVLNATTEFHAINIDPQAMQLAQMRDYSIVDWCLVFGINPYMLGVAQRGDNTYANVESRMTEFHQLTLMPWASRFESACDAELPRGSVMRVNFGALLRPETLQRYQAHRIALTEPAFLTVAEVRRLEGRPPMPAEELLEQAEAAEAHAEAAALVAAGAMGAEGAAAGQTGGSSGSGAGLRVLPGRAPAIPGSTAPGGSPPRPRPY